ncbi:MAG: hypothetical protein QM724_09880 [Flavobacteriales bacterium]
MKVLDALKRIDSLLVGLFVVFLFGSIGLLIAKQFPAEKHWHSDLADYAMNLALAYVGTFFFFLLSDMRAEAKLAQTIHQQVELFNERLVTVSNMVVNSLEQDNRRQTDTNTLTHTSPEIDALTREARNRVSNETGRTYDAILNRDLGRAYNQLAPYIAQIGIVDPALFRAITRAANEPVQLVLPDNIVENDPNNALPADRIGIKLDHVLTYFKNFAPHVLHRGDPGYAPRK